MNIIDIIIKKRDGFKLSKEEIAFAVNGYVSEDVKDYQMSSLLMAICIKGMEEEEIFDLTEVMLHSGNTLQLDSIRGIKVDKHSTGGIGDKTTVILAPLVASLGVPVAKMSGRGLGVTGGTIDKLESIEGFKTAISEDDFFKQVNEIGVALASQTGNLVPADKKIYALRDVTGTVESLPLIASSIMSKKLASGADKFVIDVKVGSGALMKTLEDATELARIMISIGSFYKKEVVCFLTKMDEPLGNAIGNGLEIKEAIDVLKGNGPKDVRNLIVELASTMVSMGKGVSLEQSRKEVEESLSNGDAYKKLEELATAQGGNLDRIETSLKHIEIKSDRDGYIHKIYADRIGKFVHELGAGRNKKEDKILYGVGVVLHKKVGEFVNRGDSLLTVYYEDEKDFSTVRDCFLIQDHFESVDPLIYKVMH